MADRKPTFTVRPPRVPAAAAAFIALGDAPGDTLLPSEGAPSPLKVVPPLEAAVAGTAEPVAEPPSTAVAPVPVATAVVVPGPAAAPRGARGRREQLRVNGAPVVQKTFYLPPELAKRLALHCAEVGCEQSAIAVEALTRYLTA